SDHLYYPTKSNSMPPPPLPPSI
ncbi:unnamed protein product, partial [Rotaria sordida]